MDKLEYLRTSRAWVDKYALPLFPGTQNPWLYSAYAHLAMRLSEIEISRELIWDFYFDCKVNDEDAGFFYRWPKGAGGPTSHDELMGAAYWSPSLAALIEGYLHRKDGEYNTHAITAPAMRYNLYRIVWLKPYLRACADLPVNLTGQAIWALKVISDGIFRTNSAKHGPGNRLRTWLMAEKMRKYPLCRLAWEFWRWRMVRRGITLKTDLRQEPDGTRNPPLLSTLIDLPGYPLPGDLG